MNPLVFINSENLAVEQLTNSDIIYTENGHLKVKVISKSMERFSDKEERIEEKEGKIRDKEEKIEDKEEKIDDLEEEIKDLEEELEECEKEEGEKEEDDKGYFSHQHKDNKVIFDNLKKEGGTSEDKNIKNVIVSFF